MELNDVSQLNARTQNLDHHGLVAATFKDLKIREKIHARIPNTDPRRIVKTGDAVLAMVLNGLGFTNRRLYLSPQFFQDKPVELLIDDKVQAKNLDDHALGEALDEIAEYGSTRLFGEIACEIGVEGKFFGLTGHLDSTSFSVEGEYSRQPEDPLAIRVTHGFSKDHRPDLKQVMMALCTSGPSAFPFWMVPQDGNASDKKEFDLTIKKIQEFRKQLKEGPPLRWVADSALYSLKGLLSHNEYCWITRVPETVGEAKRLLRKSDSELHWRLDDQLSESGYKISSHESRYGGILQRWILIYSQQAFDREKKTFEKKLMKESESLEKALWHLGNQVFGCEADIEKELNKIKKNYPLHVISSVIEEIFKNKNKGRPKADSQKSFHGFRVIANSSLDPLAVQEKLNTKGRFLLATNDLDTSGLPDWEILRDYKNQQGVERGFGFLKDPWFMVDSIFLKSPKRIEALMMIMTLCLMIYNVAQFKLRQKLKETGATLPNQLNKQIQNPTLRWIFQIMEGICRVMFYAGTTFLKQQITNLTKVRLDIIRLFGPTTMKIYNIS